MLLPGLVGPSYRSLSKSIDPAECINWFVETVEDTNSTVPGALMPSPGFTAFEELTPGPVRAALTTYDDRVFVVSGFNFYEVFSDGTSTLRGTVLASTVPSTISSNGAAGGQLFITSGGAGYCYDLLTDTLTLELASGADMGAYLSNRFIALNTTLSIIRISDLDDGTGWDPTQFAQRSLAADPWVSMRVVNSEIWLLGSVTSEVWSNQDLFPFPFAPIPGALFNEGIVGAFASTTVESVLVWVAQSEEGQGRIVRAEGYAAKRISTHPVEFALSEYDNLADAQAWSYNEQGHSFWVCNFTDGGISWAWDLTTGMWHKRGYWNPDTSAYEALRVGVHTRGFEGQHLVGDRITGQLYVMDITTATDVDGAGVRRLRIFKGPDAEDDYVFCPWLQIEFQPGVGLATGQGQNPVAMLQISRDNGYTWGPERWESIGAIGQYTARCIWRRLGSARQWAFRLVVSDPVYPLTVIRGIMQDAEQGTS